MKPWVLLACAVVGAYFAYDWWFAPEEPSEETPRLQVVVEQEKAQAAAEAEEDASDDSEPALTHGQPHRLDLGGDVVPAERRRRAVDEAALALERQRQEADATGNTALVRQLEDRLVRDHPWSDPALLARFRRGKALLDRYRETGATKEGVQFAHQARKELTAGLFLSDVDESSLLQLTDRLRELADLVLFSGRHVEGADTTYVPQRGEALSTLCRKKFRAVGAYLAPGFVAHVNGLGAPNRMRAREPLKVPLGKFELVVVKSRFRLYVLLDGAFVADYPVGLGEAGSTPLAEFVVKTKTKNPDWYPSAGVKIPYGDPRNVLGTRWLGFANTADHRGFGIHGTSDPGSIGREESSGCVRMLQQDVEQVFDWTPYGAKVTIRP